MREGWGDREFTEAFGRNIEPALAASEDGLDWFVWQNRLAVSPGAAADWLRMAMETDVTDVLGSIRAPTLVVHTRSWDVFGGSRSTQLETGSSAASTGLRARLPAPGGSSTLLVGSRSTFAQEFTRASASS
jgi:hypothetical protein